MFCRVLVAIVISAACILPVGAIEKPGVVYKVFQFPADKISRIDGNTDDWSIVPEAYVIGMDHLTDTQHGLKPDPKDLDVRVRVGWVKGLNRLAECVDRIHTPVQSPEKRWLDPHPFPPKVSGSAFGVARRADPLRCDELD